MAALARTFPLGLSLEAPKSPLLPEEEGAWVSTVVGLPLLAFGFHWLNGDCSTANILLGGALLLAGGWNYFTEEGQAMVSHSATAVASITILIISVFTGNAYGVAGSLLVGTAGLLAGTKLRHLLILPKKEALRCLMAAANLALRWALQTQQQELDRGYVFAKVANFHHLETACSSAFSCSFSRLTYALCLTYAAERENQAMAAPTTTTTSNLRFKFILLGDFGVGKTTFFHRIRTGHFLEEAHTLGQHMNVSQKWKTAEMDAQETTEVIEMEELTCAIDGDSFEKYRQEWHIFTDYCKDTWSCENRNIRV
ncbi:hypothetical protein JD844_015398 [Phrynosoma platyrhinos]|uniref:Uncharacterized protein n=1 Tax=Phrynosoma platyrhinos TaxID=52577 RepID=A0ABQ7SJ44_PHRPL|nr:hypothetical protein JD844_015398 [Phrynosoma platyrhinos]